MFQRNELKSTHFFTTFSTTILFLGTLFYKVRQWGSAAPYGKVWQILKTLASIFFQYAFTMYTLLNVIKKLAVLLLS